MTIGVAASGPRAGAAVRAAVLGAELLGRGAIGGFAVMAILDAQGELHHRVTQTGGVGQLGIPSAWLDARVAAMISSGPDRPEPLVQFLPGASQLGLVTGHRLPNRAGKDGAPLNQAVLDRLAAGQAPQDAINEVLAAHAEVDAGLIAVTANGVLGWGNSARVGRRPDQGAAQRIDAIGRLALLHNSIFAEQSADLSERLAELAWSHLHERAGAWQFLRLTRSVPILAAARDCVHVDENGDIVRLESADPHVPSLNRRATVVYLGAEVRRDGELLGHVATELYADLGDGIAAPLTELAQHTLLMRTDDVAT